MSKVRESVHFSSNRRSDYKLSNRGLIGRDRLSRSSVHIRNVGGLTTIDRKSSSFSYSYNLLSIVIVVLLICAVASSMSSGEPKTLYALLLKLENTVSIPLDWLTSWNASSIVLGNDWGIFDFMRELITTGISIVQLLAFVCLSLLNCLPFIFSIVCWIFGV